MSATPEQRPPEAQNSPRRTRRLVKVILTLSLTLNLLVLGLVVGAKMRDGQEARRFSPPDRAIARDMGFGPFIGAFPRESRREMAQALRERAGPFLDNRRALVNEMQEILNTLRAEPFDAEALNGLLSAQGNRIRERAEIGRGVLIEQIGKMTPRERARFADDLERGLRHSMDRVRSDWKDRARDRY
ncbi:periplasmic heavy metal sensor [Aliiroseovarius sp.]|uniref:periplasmic heavy metal sensor n=1 Tax=Aliiroseovarius sp. TaxID=1872442 RepID=UPI0026122076|nr:periplasmic heavy metal sensor [Aliiroseovarius sp.]